MQFSCCAWKVFNLGHRSMTRGKYLLLRVTALLSGKFYALCSKSSLLLCWFLGSRISLGGMASCPPKSWLMFCTKFTGIEPWLGGMWCGYRKQGYGREWQRFSGRWHGIALLVLVFSIAEVSKYPTFGDCYHETMFFFNVRGQLTWWLFQMQCSSLFCL